MSSKEMLKLLGKLGYYEIPGGGRGSHVKLRHETYGPILLRNHAGKDFAPGTVRDILLKQVGLSSEKAREVLRGNFS